MLLSFHSGHVTVTHFQGWGDRYQGGLGCKDMSPVSLSALTGIAGTVAVASRRSTVLQGLSIPRPSLSDLPAREQAVTLLVLSPQLKTYPLTRSLWGKPGIQSPQKFVYAVQLHNSIMCWQHLQAPVCSLKMLAVLVCHFPRANWPHRRLVAHTAASW